MSSILLKDKIDILKKAGIEKQVENSINKIINFQLAKYQKFVQEITDELKVFENSYHLSSLDFFRKFKTGEMGDAADYIEWAGLYENFQYYNEKISLLKSAA